MRCLRHRQRLRARALQHFVGYSLRYLRGAAVEVGTNVNHTVQNISEGRPHC